MKRWRSLELFSCAFLIVWLAGAAPATAQTPPAQLHPTEKPFLWRIDGPVPSYLYGTVHVPDPAVLALPDVVRRALEASDVFSGEIPLDAGTQASLLGKIMLPQGQDLRKLAGEDVFTRVVRIIAKVLGNSAPPGAADLLAATLSSMKPWAVMSQVEALEFLPDVMAGRQPLDVMLYSMAEKSGKELGALETVDEQVAVFEGFSNEEQVKMLIEALDEMEKPSPSGVSATRRSLGAVSRTTAIVTGMISLPGCVCERNGSDASAMRARVGAGPSNLPSVGCMFRASTSVTYRDVQVSREAGCRERPPNPSPALPEHRGGRKAAVGVALVDCRPDLHEAVR